MISGGALPPKPPRFYFSRGVFDFFGGRFRPGGLQTVFSSRRGPILVPRTAPRAWYRALGAVNGEHVFMNI